MSTSEKPSTSHSSDQTQVPHADTTNEPNSEYYDVLADVTKDADPDQYVILEEDILSEEEKAEVSSLTEEERLERAVAFKREGNEKFGEGDFEECVRLYTLGLRFCPDCDPEFRGILFANRSAANIKLDKTDAAIDDCTQAIKLSPNYVRAFLRRAKLFEQTDKLDESLADFKRVQELDPGNTDAYYAVQRLPGMIHEKNEKMKTEMLAKLKELGNMVLRPFGLSTNNFQMQQDASGGYSINFKQ